MVKCYGLAYVENETGVSASIEKDRKGTEGVSEDAFVTRGKRHKGV